MIKRFLAIGYVALTAIGCAQSEDFDAMAKRMASDKVSVVFPDSLGSEHVVLLDSREKEEYDISHIPGAIWIGYDDFDLSNVSAIDKNAHVVVYCSVGYRSGKIGEKLQKDGFSDVSNLYGGIFKWVNEGKTLEDAQGSPTTEIHGYNRRWSKWVEKGEVTW